MAYVIDESLSAKNYTPKALVKQVFGTPRLIDSGTIHHWGSPGQRGADVLDWFCNPRSSAKTSAHFVVWADNIYCIVPPEDASWAAGNAYGNATSIHIECRPEATGEDYATVAWLVAWLRDKYGDFPLYPHSHWTPTACPGVWDLARLDALARDTIVTAADSTQPIEESEMNAEQERKLNAVYDAIFNGGTSMPEGKPLKDLVNDSFSAIRAELAAIRESISKEPSDG